MIVPIKKLSYLSLLLFALFLNGCKQDSNKETQAPIESQTDELASNSEPVEEITYAQVPIMPRFPGCEDIEHPMEKHLCAQQRLNNYIQNRLRYPRPALNNQIEGTVTAQFVVRPDGLIDDIGVHNDLGFGTGEIVLKIIQSMNHMNERWIPGRKDGKAVRVRLAMPIEFRLMDYQKEEGYQPGD